MVAGCAEMVVQSFPYWAVSVAARAEMLAEMAASPNIEEVDAFAERSHKWKPAGRPTYLGDPLFEACETPS